jgi:hypothetical protein
MPSATSNPWFRSESSLSDGNGRVAFAILAKNPSMPHTPLKKTIRIECEFAQSGGITAHQSDLGELGFSKPRRMASQQIPRWFFELLVGPATLAASAIVARPSLGIQVALHQQ